MAFQLLPLMEALYKVEDQSQEQRAYMILVCLVIITQDKLFNQNLHHLVRCLERTVFFFPPSTGSLAM